MKYLPYREAPEEGITWTNNYVATQSLEATSFIPAGCHIAGYKYIPWIALVVRRDTDGFPQTE